MITRCPNCFTSFRITAEHLRPAHGQVQCGMCNQQFDAIEHLLEEEVPEVAPSQPVEPEPSPVEVTAESAKSAEQAPLQVEDARVEAAPKTPPARAPLRIDSTTIDDETVDLRFDFGADASVLAADIEKDVAALPSTNTARRGVEDLLLEDLPRVDVDRDEVEAIRHYLREGTDLPRASPWWGVVAALLVLVLSGQVAWDKRETIFEKLPQARAMWDHLCEGRACALPVKRDIPSLHVLSRDVREHPQYRNALLVNATVVNEAAFAQPYPVVELTLFDQSGAAIGARRFEPSEYLDSSIAIDAGMKPEQPVYIVLELAGVAEHAVSFEFKFL